MEKKEFKQILQSALNDAGLAYVKKNFYYNDENMIIMVNIQKSNYGNSYYINYGFCVKEINNISNPHISECDIMGRFVNYGDGKKAYDFELEKLSREQFIQSLDKNIYDFIFPVQKYGICKYFELYPRDIVAAKSRLRDYIANLD